MTEMRATREALEPWADAGDDCGDPTCGDCAPYRAAVRALAEVAVFERIAEEARELTDKPFGSLDFRAFYRVREALDDMDRLRGQEQT